MVQENIHYLNKLWFHSEDTRWDSNRKGKQSQNMQKEKYEIFLTL